MSERKNRRKENPDDDEQKTLLQIECQNMSFRTDEEWARLK